MTRQGRLSKVGPSPGEEIRERSIPIQPLRLISIGLCIAACSLIWALVIPGIVAYTGGVFYKEQIAVKLPATAKLKLKEFEAQQEKRRQQLALLDSTLTSPNPSPSSEDVERLLRVRTHLKEELASAMPPVSAIPFHLNPQLLLWPAIYTCLGWLIILFKPEHRQHAAPRRFALQIVALGTLIYILYEWPLWMRNFVLTNEGRTVYAYPNFDIHPGSFFAQEAVVFGYCVLLAIFWSQWAHFFKHRQSEIYSDKLDPYKIVFDQPRLDRLSQLFVQWQVCSVILSLGFLFFTNFFWTLVAKYNDQRYLLSAIMAHLLWGISWVMISLPLIATWKHWSRARTQAFAAIAEDKRITTEEQTILKQLLSEMHPLSGVSISLSSASSFVSFVLPIIQLFTR